MRLKVLLQIIVLSFFPCTVQASSTNAFICNSGTNTVSDIDIAGNTVTSITVGAAPYALAITPDGTKAFVCNSAANTVSVVNTADQSILATISSVPEARAIAITPDGTKAFTCDYAGGRVSVIDAVGYVVIGSPLVIGDNPNSIVITPDGTKAYVSNGNTTVASINTTSYALTPITVGVGPAALAITPDGSKVYVCNEVDNTVQAIDTSLDTAGTAIAVGNGPSALAITPDGSKAYVCNYDDGTVSVIPIPGTTVTHTITVGAGPYSIAITPDGSKAYICNYTDNTVSVINTTSNTVIGSPITVGTNPIVVGITSDGTNAYVCNYTSNNVSKIPIPGTTVANTITVGTHPIALAFFSVTSSPPTANPQSQSFVVNSINNAITLTGTHNGGTGSFTFTQGTGPLHGTLSGLPNGTGAVTYTPTSGYIGSDSFTFTVTDTAGTSTPATVSITITDTVPTANSQSVSVVVNSINNSITLTGSDAGGATLTFNVPSTSAHGTLTFVSNPTTSSALYRYTPTAAYVGLDSFAFTVTNTSAQTSASALVSISVNPAGVPIANPTAASVVQNVATVITLTGLTTQPNLTFSIVAGPSHGTLSSLTQSPPRSANVTYTSTGSYVGADSFTFKVTDNIGQVSSTVTVPVMVVLPSTKAYVANVVDNNIGIISVSATNKMNVVTDSGDLIHFPSVVAVCPNGIKAYVCNEGMVNTVTSINTLTNTVIQNVNDAAAPFSGPGSIAVTPDGTRAYVVNQNDNSVSIITVATDTTLGFVAPAAYPFDFPVSIAITPDGSKAYVSNSGNNTVSIIDLNTSSATYNKVIGYVSDAGSYLVGNIASIVISPNGNTAYVVNNNGSGGRGSVVIVNVATNSTTGIIDDSAHHFDSPYSMAITLDGTKAYVTNSSGNSVSIINIATATVTGFVTDLGSPTFDSPLSVAFTADGTKSYVVNQAGSSVSIINVTSNTVVSALYGYDHPRAVAFLGGPIANPAAASVVQNVGTVIELTGVADSGTLTFTITSQPSHGALSGFSRISATKVSYTYTSDESYVGADSFAFTVTDAIGTSAVVTVSVMVVPPSVRAYVVDEGNNDIGLVSVDFGASVGAVTDYATRLINGPQALAVSSDGSKVYVGNVGNNTVSYVNPLTNTMIRDVDQTLSAFSGPVSIAFTPSGTIAYVVNDTGSVSIVNALTDATLGSVDLQSFSFNLPVSIAITPDGMKAYVANQSGNHVNIIDLNPLSVTYNKVIGYVADSDSYLSGNLIDIVISPDGSTAYVVNTNGNGGRGSVVIINVANDATTGIIDDTAYNFHTPQAIAITADGTKAYVCNYNGNSVSIIDTVTNIATGFVIDLLVPILHHPVFGSFTSDGTKAYVVNEFGSLISIIDVASDTVISSITGYSNPTSIAFLGGPAANQTAATVVRNSEITLTVSVTPDSAPATFTIVTQPSYGTLSSVSSTSTSHTYHYTSNGMYSGPDSFTVQATNPLNPLPTEITVPIVVALPSTRAYVADAGHNNVGIISVSNAASAGIITDTVHLVHAPISLAVSPQGIKAYVGNDGANTITSINSLTNATIQNVTGTFNNPSAIAFTPDGTKAYVVNSGSNSVNVIDAQTDTVIASVNENGFPFNQPSSIIIMSDGMKAYVVNEFGANVSIIDLDLSSSTYNKVVGYVVDVSSLLSGDVLSEIALTPDGSRAYVTNQNNGSYAVVIIDAINDIVTGTVDENGFSFDVPIGIAISPDGMKAYVGNGTIGGSFVSIVDVNPASGSYNKVTGIVTDGSLTFNTIKSIVFSADSSKAYVVNSFGNSVSIVDAVSDTVTSSISGYLFPFKIAVLGFGGPFFSITNQYIAPVTSALDATTGILYEVGYAQDGSGDLVVMANNVSSGVFGPVASFTKTGQSDYGVVSYSTTSLLNIGGVSFTQLDMALQTVNGVSKVIVSGSNDNYELGFVARFNTVPVANSLDGVLDDTFGDYQSGSSGPRKGYTVFTGVAPAVGNNGTSFSSCAVDVHQNVVVAGSVGTGGGASQGQLIVARYTAADGVLDTTFGPVPQAGYAYTQLLGLSGSGYTTIINDIEFDPLKNIYIVGQYQAPLIPAPGLGQQGVAGTSPFVAKFVSEGVPDQSFYTQYGTLMIPVQYVNGQGEFNKCLYDIAPISNLSSPTMYASGFIENVNTNPPTDYAALIRFSIANLNLSQSQAFISGNAGAPLTNLQGNICPSLVVPAVTAVAQIANPQGPAANIFNSIQTSKDVQNVLSLSGIVYNLVQSLQAAGGSESFAQSVGNNFQSTMIEIIDNFVANYSGNLLQNFLYLSQSVAVNECLFTTGVSKFVYLQLVYAAEKAIQINIKTAAMYCKNKLANPYN